MPLCESVTESALVGPIRSRRAEPTLVFDAVIAAAHLGRRRIGPVAMRRAWFTRRPLLALGSAVGQTGLPVHRAPAGIAPRDGSTRRRGKPRPRTPGTHTASSPSPATPRAGGPGPMTA